MSASRKRVVTAEPADRELLVIPQKQSHKDQNIGSLHAFIEWAEVNHFFLNKKVVIETEGSCAQYGMVAMEEINAGEILFQIPRSMILSPKSSSIADILEKESSALASASGWVPLLLSLMHEYNNTNSKWRPYLDLFPNYMDLDQPMFWPESEQCSLLAGTGVIEATKKDLVALCNEFKMIVLPFIERHKEHFREPFNDISFYKKMVAFVLAYSFTEPAIAADADAGTVSATPMMCPMADILNHVADNNAHLSFEKDSLNMVAVKHINKGEEIFNTYGELPNSQLMHMYGFAEPYPNNHFDTVDIPMTDLYDAAKVTDVNKLGALLDKKWSFLNEMDLVSDDGMFVMGVDGALTEEELYQTLKVLVMSEAQFTQHQEKEGWSESEMDENEMEESLMFDAIPKVPETWKDLLRRVAYVCLKRYKSTLDDDDQAMNTAATLPTRQRFALYTQYGQKKLLYTLIDSCK